eukprot:4477347-Alexandrium_andersonii.AAC.1
MIGRGRRAARTAAASPQARSSASRCTAARGHAGCSRWHALSSILRIWSIASFRSHVLSLPDRLRSLCRCSSGVRSCMLDADLCCERLALRHARASRPETT